MAFSVVSGGGSFSVPTNHGQKVTVQIAPTVSGSFAGEIQISSSDPKKPTVEVLVEATADPGRSRRRT